MTEHSATQELMRFGTWGFTVWLYCVGAFLDSLWVIRRVGFDNIMDKVCKVPGAQRWPRASYCFALASFIITSFLWLPFIIASICCRASRWIRRVR